MKKLFFILLLLPLITVVSCKKESSGGGDTHSLSSITITALHDPVISGIQDFKFRVRGNDGNTYTSTSTVYVNDNAITGNVFTPTTGGSYSVYAKRNDLKSETITVTATTIELAVESDRTTTYIEMEPFIFKAKGSNGVYYTDRAKFYVNGDEISGHSFDPDVAGDYIVHAVIGDNIIVSPDVTLTATVGYENLTISSDRNSYVVGQTATFSAIDNLGRNLSSSTTFKVNATAISGNTYAVTSAGDFTLEGSFNGIDADDESFTVGVATHTTKVLVEDYTGTWCGWCWYMAKSIDDALDQSDNVVPVGIHNGDPMASEYNATMTSAFGVGGYPAGRINRIHNWDQSSQDGEPYYTFSQLQNYLDKPVGLGLGINSSLNGSNVDISVKVTYDITYAQSLKLVVYLLEDDLVYSDSPQKRYHSDGTATTSYPDFVHKHVLRKAASDIFGDEIPVSDREAGDIYTVNYSQAIPGEVQDNSKLSIVAFVVDSETKEVINVQKANIGVNQDFD